MRDVVRELSLAPTMAAALTVLTDLVVIVPQTDLLIIGRWFPICGCLVSSQSPWSHAREVRAGTGEAVGF